MEFGLIGGQLKHSYSKEIHALLSDYRYELFELQPKDLPAFLKKRDFCGLNVTIPYKEAVIPYLDYVDPAAQAIGAVNTVVNRDGKLYGYNTDFAGMREFVQKSALSFEEKKVLILGSGGTAKTAISVFKSLNVGKIILVSRTPKEAEKKINNCDAVLDYETALRLHKDADVLVNTTPVGMYPNDGVIPVDLSPFTGLQAVFDVIYHPLRTALVLQARERNIFALGGLYMLCSQAHEASALFTGKTPERRKDEVTRAITGDKQNLVLIGMPGAGKTAVGRLLAEKLHRPLRDMDEVLYRKTGKRSGEWIRTAGEAAFRKKEAECVAETGKETGVIISTGGGTVTETFAAENLRALRQNGLVIFLDRPESELKISDTRPLSDSEEKLHELYERRLPLYRAAADLTVPVRGTKEETAEALLRCLSENDY